MGQKAVRILLLVDSSTGSAVTSLSLWGFLLVLVFTVSKMGARITNTHTHTKHVCKQQWMVTHPGVARRS